MKNIFALFALIFAGCVGIPDGVTAIDGFEINRYLGTWYEIARFDHSFEKNLSNVKATYSLRNDDGVNVLNQGFNDETKEWSSAEGKAFFVINPTIGRLKVSFFWPFYGGYNIIYLDKENYSYSLVCGNDKDYLWILSRTKTLSKETLNMLVDKAKSLGFDTNKFIYVDQSKN
jgi:apolipoprotein D and lipocalin family protein